MPTFSIRHLLPFFAISFFVLASLTNTHAETTRPGEKELPIEIKADSLIAQDAIGESTYKGNVIITQGMTKIIGETVTIFHPNRQVNKAIILGTPATFKKFNEEDQTWVNGQAKKITYHTQDKIVLLEGDAHVNQAGKNSIAGPEITYNLTDKTLSAKGTEANKKRITVTFQPEPKTESETPKSAQQKAP